MACCAVAAGLHTEAAISQLRTLPDNRWQPLAGEKFKANKVPELFTREFAEALNVYGKYKEMGLPYAGGWADQPAHVVHLIMAMRTAETVATKKESE